MQPCLPPADKACHAIVSYVAVSALLAWDNAPTALKRVGAATFVVTIGAVKEVADIIATGGLTPTSRRESAQDMLANIFGAALGATVTITVRFK